MVNRHEDWTWKKPKEKEQSYKLDVDDWFESWKKEKAPASTEGMKGKLEGEYLRGSPEFKVFFIANLSKPPAWISICYALENVRKKILVRPMKYVRNICEQEPWGSEDATTSSAFFVHFLSSDGRTDRRTVILMSFMNCPWLSLGSCQISSSLSPSAGPSVPCYFRPTNMVVLRITMITLSGF